MNKELWKTLTLTSDAELMNEPLGDTGGHGDGVQHDGAGHGARQPDADDDHGGGEDDVHGGDDERRDDGLGQGSLVQKRLDYNGMRSINSCAFDTGSKIDRRGILAHIHLS